MLLEGCKEENVLLDAELCTEQVDRLVSSVTFCLYLQICYGKGGRIYHVSNFENVLL